MPTLTRALGAALLATPALALAQSAVPAAPASAQALHLAGLAATCANCHGTGGKAVEGSAVPGLAGMPSDYLVAQMQAFRSGARPATVMHQLAKGYSDAQVQQLAAYFAAQPKWGRP